MIRVNVALKKKYIFYFRKDLTFIVSGKSPCGVIHMRSKYIMTIYF